MNGPTVLVTGGSGFIGTWVLRELLERGIRSVAFDRSPDTARWRSVLGDAGHRVVFEEGSLPDIPRLIEILNKYEITHIIHLAAMLTPACQNDPFEGCRVNVLGSVALFESVRLRTSQPIGISYASSYAVYGPEPDDDPSVESTGNHPPTFYGVFKQAVDQIAEQYWREFGIASVGIRPHVVYGPERTQGLTAGPSLAARAAVSGDRYTIGYTGCVGYDYVEDVARAFVRAAMETPSGAIVVDLPGERVTPDRFVEILDQVVPGAAARLFVNGPEIAPNIPPSPNFISRLFPDWRATPLTDGVRRTVDFYRARSADLPSISSSTNEVAP